MADGDINLSKWHRWDRARDDESTSRLPESAPRRRFSDERHESSCDDPGIAVSLKESVSKRKFSEEPCESSYNRPGNAMPLTKSAPRKAFSEDLHESSCNRPGNAMSLKGSAPKRKFSEEPSGLLCNKSGFTMSLKGNMAAPCGEQPTNTGIGLVVAPIKMSLGKQKLKDNKQLKTPVCQAFNDDADDDDESEEEMPPEAKMRMRNIGRDTPTAAGPNSFGKGKLGFCDRQRIVQKEQIEKELATENSKT